MRFPRAPLPAETSCSAWLPRFLSRVLLVLACCVLSQPAIAQDNGDAVDPDNAVDLRVREDVTEAGKNLTFRADLTTKLDQDITLSWSVTGGTASADDFKRNFRNTGTVTIGAGRRGAPIRFYPVDDSDVEGPETLELTIAVAEGSPLPSGVTVGTATATATIGDNDDPSQPDLVIDRVGLLYEDTSWAVNQPFVVYGFVRNQGGGASAATRIRFFSSSDRTITPDDTEWPAHSRTGSLSVGEIAAGTVSERYATAYFIPDSGPVWVGACVDTVGSEVHTANNCSNGIYMSINPPGVSDLVINEVSVSDTKPYVGASFTVSAEVENRSYSVASAATTLRYYRSDDPRIDTSDFELGTDPVVSLDRSYDGQLPPLSLNSASVSIPTEGKFWIGVCIDPVDTEFTTFNNCSDGVKVTVAEAPDNPVDLRVVRDVTEGDKLLAFRADLTSKHTQDVTLSWSVTGGTASADDFNAVFRDTGTVTIPAGRLSAPIYFRAIDDGDVEAAETLELTIAVVDGSSLPPGVTVGTATVTATINDAPVPDNPITLRVIEDVAEADGLLKFRAELASKHTQDITLAWSVTGGSASADDFNGTFRDAGTVTIGADRVGAPIRFTLVDDDDVEGPETLELTIAAADGSPLPSGVIIGTATATATIADNDNAAAPPQQALPWSATLTVGLGSGVAGYCPGACPIDEDAPFGTLGQGDSDSFTVPGSSDTVAVKAIVWNSRSLFYDLRIFLDPLPAKSVYEQWTLTVNGVTFNLSDNDGVVTVDGGPAASLRFDNFFAGRTRPGENAAVEASLAVGTYERADTTLNALSLSNPDGSGVALSPGFSSGTTSYTAFDADIVSPLTVVATATDNTASVVVTPADSDQAAAGHQVAVTGPTVITTTVTNGSDVQTYVIRAAPVDPPPLWSASLTVAAVTGASPPIGAGYCPAASCPVTGLSLGTKIEADSFTAPGTSDTVTVTAMVWGVNNRDLRLFLDPVPAKSVYDQLTLTVHNTAVSLSDNDGVSTVSGDTAASIQFDNFFSSDQARPGEGDTITVSLTVGEGDDTGGGDPVTTLNALTLAEADGTTVALSSTFASATTSYTASVANDVSSLTVAATATDDTGARVTFSPADSDSTAEGHQVALSTGNTTVTATVTNGSATQDYTITVTRASAPESLWSATLAVGLGSGVAGYCPGTCPVDEDGPFGTLGQGDSDSFTVPGTSDTVAVKAIVWNSRSLFYDLSIFLDPLPAKSAYEQWTLTVNGVTFNLSDNDGVVAEGTAGSLRFDDFFSGRTRPGENAVVAASLAVGVYERNDTTLNALSLSNPDGSGVALSPGFTSGTTSYTAFDADIVSPLTVVATATDNTARVVVTPADSDSTTAGHQVAVTEPTVITTTVTNGSDVQTYVIRAAPVDPPPLWSASLTVAEVTGNTPPIGRGYCPAASCPVSGLSLGTKIEDDSFTAPGTDTTVTVTAVVWGWNNRDLRLFLDPLPAKSVYEQWTLTVHDTSVALSDNDGVSTVSGDTAASIQFQDFFSSDQARPDEGDTITVSLTVGEGDGGGGEGPVTTLNALSLAETDGTTVALSSAFASGTTSYTASVANDVSSLTVAATVTDDTNASVTFAPADSDSTAEGHQVALSTGDTVVTATVSNGSATRDYTITVTRASAPGPLWSATFTVAAVTGTSPPTGTGYCPANSCPVSGLSLGTKIEGEGDSFTVPDTDTTVTVTAMVWGTGAAGRDLRLFLDPLPAKFVYEQWTLTVRNTSVALSDNDGVSTVSGDTADSILFEDFFDRAIVPPRNNDRVNVSLFVGEDDGRGGPDTSLNALTLTDDGTAVALSPTFAWRTTSYTASVAGDVSSLTVAATATDNGASVVITPADSDQATAGHQVAVTGNTTVTATVTNGGDSQAYTIAVTRPVEGFWSAAFTVDSTNSNGADILGYCPGSCPVTGVSLGTTVQDDSFPLGVVEMTVRGIVWDGGSGNHDLRLYLSPFPPPVLSDQWTLTVDGIQAAVADATRSGDDSLASYEFVDFFSSDAARPVDGEVITVALSREGAAGSSIEPSAAAGFSVSDAEAHEDPGAQLAFNVSLDQGLESEARVTVSTRDGSAKAGQDYEAVSDTLIFAPGETEKTVLVPVLNDSHDEGREEMTLVLSDPVGAAIGDGEGTGAIVNSDAIPKAWIARFGRTVTSQVLDAVEARLTAAPQTGWRATLAGQALPSWNGEAGVNQTANQASTETLQSWRDWFEQAGAGSEGVGLSRRSRTVTAQDLVSGTSFALSARGSQGDHFSVWGDASVAGFDGREDGLDLDGRVTTGLVGADWATDGWMAGMAIGHSVGTGGYRRGDCASGSGCGSIEADLTGFYPYAGLDLTERVTAWAAAGYGSGELTVTPDGAEALTTDLTMSMGAVGLRGELLRPERAEGLSLALTSEARVTQTASEAVQGPGGNLAEAVANVWTGRAGVEGARRFGLGRNADGASLTPSFELGVRVDGGDAEQGLGADIGGGLVLSDPDLGLSLDVRGRGLLIHEADGFKEWGASAALAWDPQPTTDRGLNLSLRQSWGASPSGTVDALLNPETFSGFVNTQGADRGFEASSRLDGEVGYGVPMFGNDFTGTFNAGFGLFSGDRRDYRVGWRLSREQPSRTDVELRFDIDRREYANDDPRHGVTVLGTIRFRW